MIGGVSKVVIEVEDQERAKRFWAQTLGFEVVQDAPYGEERWLEVCTPDKAVAVVLDVRKGPRPAPQDRSLPTSNVSFYTDDLKQTYAELTARGVEFPQPPVQQPFGWWSIFEDPEGNRFALTPRGQWAKSRQQGWTARALNERPWARQGEKNARHHRHPKDHCQAGGHLEALGRRTQPHSLGQFTRAHHLAGTIPTRRCWNREVAGSTRAQVQGCGHRAAAGVHGPVFLPLGGKMDWAHSISDVDGERSVTFNISITGPTSPLLAPMLKRILRRELPSTLSKLIALAEQT